MISALLLAAEGLAQLGCGIGAGIATIGAGLGTNMILTSAFVEGCALFAIAACAFLIK